MSLTTIRQLYNEGLDVYEVAKRLNLGEAEIRKKTVYLLKLVGASVDEANHYALNDSNPLNSYFKFRQNFQKLLNMGAGEFEARMFAQREYAGHSPITEYMKSIHYSIIQSIKQKYGENMFLKILEEYNLIRRIFSKTGYEIKTLWAIATIRYLRKMGKPVTFNDIVEEFLLGSRRVFLKQYNTIQKKIGGVSPQNPEDFIRDGIKKLGLSKNQEAESLIFYRDNKRKMIGRRPKNIAAGVLYLTTDKTEKEIAEVLGLSETSIRDVKKVLKIKKTNNIEQKRNSEKRLIRKKQIVYVCKSNKP